MVLAAQPTAKSRVVTEPAPSPGSFYDYELFVANGGDPAKYKGKLSRARQEHLRNSNRDNTRLGLQAPCKPIGIPEELLALRTLLNQYQPCAHQRPEPHSGLRFGLRKDTFNFDGPSKISNIHEIKNTFLGLFTEELEPISDEHLRRIKSSFSFSREGVPSALIADPRDFAKGTNEWISDTAVAAGILLDREKNIRNLVMWLIDSNTGRFREDAMDKLHNAYINFGTLIKAVRRRLPKSSAEPSSTTVRSSPAPRFQRVAPWSGSNELPYYRSGRALDPSEALLLH